MRAIVAFALLISLGFCRPASAQTDAEKLVNEYQENQLQNTTKQCVFTLAKTKYFDTDSSGPSFWRIETELRQDGEKAKLATRQWLGLKSQDEIPQQVPFTQVGLWDGEKWYEYVDTNSAASSTMIIGSKKVDSDQYIKLGVPDAPLNGYFKGDLANVVDIIFPAIRSPGWVNEPSNNTNYRQLSANTPYGKYLIQFDPSQRFNIANAQISKSANDKLFGNPVAEFQPATDLSEDFATTNKGNPAVRYEFKINNILFRNLGDKTVPTKSEYQSKIYFKNGRIISEDVDIERSYINIAPDFSDSETFKPHVPDGTRVLFLNKQMPIEYTWLHGQPVVDANRIMQPLVDKRMRELTAYGPHAKVKSDSQPTSSFGRILAVDGSNIYLLIGCAVFIIGVVLAIVFRVRLRRRPE